VRSDSFHRQNGNVKRDFSCKGDVIIMIGSFTNDFFPPDYQNRHYLDEKTAVA
jgi:hypothetical protein